MRELLGDRLDPFFTPPWNRCTRDTGEVLVELGFTLLSREHKAEPLGLLPELPVHLDVARLSPEELDTRFAAQVRNGGPVGVMFHHGVMEPDDMARASELLALLAGHEHVVARCDGRAQPAGTVSQRRGAASAARTRGMSATLRTRTGATSRMPSSTSLWISVLRMSYSLVGVVNITTPVAEAPIPA